MSWIKTSFLWMMYRSGWGTKPDQEVILAIRLKTDFFDAVLSKAVVTAHAPALWPNVEEWQRAGQKADVRVQWDPDRGPRGGRVQRRAIQLGLRGALLREYAKNAILDIEDITDFVAEQRPVADRGSYSRLITPHEAIYRPSASGISGQIGLDSHLGNCDLNVIWSVKPRNKQQQ